MFTTLAFAKRNMLFWTRAHLMASISALFTYTNQLRFSRQENIKNDELAWMHKKLREKVWRRISTHSGEYIVGGSGLYQ